MRTLKRSLALVLALVMVLGFSAFAVADFNDAAEIQYKEAVAVLSGIGVLNGKPAADGTYDFDPAGTLTRAEAAKILTFLMKAEDIKAKSTFTDTVGHWAEGSIAYIAAKGIVEGYAGEYNPEDTLTGAAFGKMLLGALGYDAKVEGMTGDTWEVAVGSLLKKLQLTKGIVGFDGTAALTREAAAQMALNALYVDEVEYLNKGTTIKVNGVEMITGATPATAVNTGVENLAKEHYLTKTDLVAHPENDSFGRPLAYKYTISVPNTPAKTVSGTAAPVMTSTAVITAAELYNTLGYAAVIDGSECWWNTTTGGQGTYWVTSAGAVSGGNSDDITVSAKAVNVGGNGIITEIYKTATNTYKMVQIMPTLAKVGTPVNVPATAGEGAKTTYSVAGLTLVDYTTAVRPIDKDNFVSDVALVKDAYVMVYGNATAGYTVKAATLVEGKLTAYNTAAGYTVADKAYGASGAAAYTATLTDAIGSVAYNTKATFVVDAYGYVMGTVTLTVPTNYVYALSAGAAKQYLNTTTNLVETVYEVPVVTTAGEVMNIKVAQIDTDGATATYDYRNALAGTVDTTKALYSYTINPTTGKYSLYYIAGDNVDSVNKTPALATGKVADTATKYYVAKYNANTYTWAVTAYTGYANLSLVGNPSDATYLDVNSDNVAEIVFVNGGTLTGATANYVYVTGSFTSDGTVYTYDVIANGVASKMALTGVSGAGLYNISGGTATKLTTGDATALVLDLATPANSADGIYTNSTYFTFANGLVKTASSAAGTYSYLAPVAETVPVYTFQYGACTTGTAADLAAANGTLVVFDVNATGTAVQAIYIVK